MLHAIRDRATGWLAYLIIFLISIPFALWGISEYLGFGFNPDVAEVNGESITVERFNRRFQTAREQSPPPGATDPEEWDRDLKRYTLEGLINRLVLYQYLDERRLDVTEEEVARVIHEEEVVHVDGRFDPQRYLRILRAKQLDVEQYERDHRNDLRRNIIGDMMGDSSLVTDAEARDYMGLKEQTRDFRYFEIKRERFVDAEAITEEDVRADYEASLEKYETPEQARVAWLELNLEDMDEEAEELDEEAIVAWHETHALDFMTPELRRMRQIFLKNEDEEEEEDETQTTETEEEGTPVAAEEQAEEEQVTAEEQAKTLHERLLDGADFATLATEHSQDEISKTRGGEIGWVALEDLPEDLGTLAFSLAANTVSEPIQTRRGWYLLEVQEIQEAQLKPLDEVRDLVVEQARRAALEGRFAVALEELSVLAYENPESLTAAAEKLGLEVQSTELEPLDELSEDVLNEPAVQAALRREDVLREGLNSDRVELTPNHSVVVRVDEYQASATQPFEEVAEDIREALVEQAASDAMLLYAAGLIEQLHAGATLETLVESENAELADESAAAEDADAEVASEDDGMQDADAEAENEGDEAEDADAEVADESDEAEEESDAVELVAHTGLKRSAGEAPWQVLRKVFALPRPTDADTPVYGMALLDEGVAVAALDAVHAAEDVEAEDSDIKILRSWMQNSEAEAVQDSLLVHSQIVRYPEQME